ncbi:MAG: SCP2 sterol-binding domain-containing protein [Actinomycetota bacterium]|nr:SCP2 sterol-binding domain-containing protein [Actinomycetota bacterium]
MPVFPSQSWMEDFCARLRQHPRTAEAAGVLDGRYRFVVEPSGPLTERHVYDIVVRPGDDGAGPDVGCVDDPAGDARLTLAADYGRWVQLIRGELDLAMAVMLRRLRVSGDLSGIMRHLSSVQPLTDALGAVDTRWLDEQPEAPGQAR